MKTPRREPRVGFCHAARRKGFLHGWQTSSSVALPQALARHDGQVNLTRLPEAVGAALPSPSSPSGVCGSGMSAARSYQESAKSRRTCRYVVDGMISSGQPVSMFKKLQAILAAGFAVIGVTTRKCSLRTLRPEGPQALRVPGRDAAAQAAADHCRRHQRRAHQGAWGRDAPAGRLNPIGHQQRLGHAEVALGLSQAERPCRCAARDPAASSGRCSRWTG